MKASFFLLLNLLLISQLITAQSVTLSTTTNNPTGGTVVYNNNTNELQYWNGTAWIPLTNAASGTGWALNGANINNNNAGNVGIVTSTPKATFNVADGKTVLFGADSSGFGNKLIWYASKGAFRAGYSSYNWVYNNVGNYSVAMGYNTIASGLNSMAMGYYTFALGEYASTMGYNTNASGNYATALGCNTGASGDYATAIGRNNNLNPNGIFMVGNGNSSLNRYTAFIVRSDNNFVGIGVENPIAPLHVANFGTPASVNNGQYFDYNNNGFHPYSSGSPTSFNPVSIVADGGILSKVGIGAYNYIAFSDARIKSIIGKSNSTDDLATLNKIQITNYTMKDKAAFSNQTFKKVIAQQVEEVFPQAVSKMTSVVPDIFSLSQKVNYDKLNKTLTVSLSTSYNIKVGDKIEFIHEKEGKKQAIVESVLDNSFTVNDWQYPTDKIFVYGREVNDFRSVDYEAISMLGISAIQQLAKENEELRNKMKSYESRLEAIEASLRQPTGK